MEDVLTKIALFRAQVGNDPDIITTGPRGVGSTYLPMTCGATDYIASQRLWEMEDTLPRYPPNFISRKLRDCLEPRA